MSRSHRKTPVCGITTAESDKLFKAAEHRRERRAVRSVLPGEDAPAPKQFGNPWASPKDGKQWFDPARQPKLMRK